MLVLLTTLLLLHASLAWKKSDIDPSDQIAPDPTGCKDGESFTYCQVTFYCGCVWTMPTMFGTAKGCGVTPLALPEKNEKDDSEGNNVECDEIDGGSVGEQTEWHPVLFPNSQDWRNCEEDDVDSGDDDTDKDSSDIGPTDEPEDPDTEGCGRWNEDETMLSLRPACIRGYYMRYLYMPGNIPSILRIIHETTGGQCIFKNRSVKKPKKEKGECSKAKLKLFADMNEKELDFQAEYIFAISVKLWKKNVRQVNEVIKTVGKQYIEKYNMTSNPCRRPAKTTPRNRREILCQL